MLFSVILFFLFLFSAGCAHCTFLDMFLIEFPLVVRMLIINELALLTHFVKNIEHMILGLIWSIAFLTHFLKNSSIWLCGWFLFWLNVSMRLKLWLSFHQIRTIDRNCEIPHEGPFCDLMWSDPEEIETWAVSPRGAGWLFGSRVTAEVCIQ